MPSLSKNGSRWLRLAGLVLALMLSCWGLFNLRVVVTPLIVALLLAYILNPLVVWLQERGHPRFSAVVGLCAAGMLLLLVGGVGLLNEIVTQCVQLRGALMEYLNDAHSTSTPAHWWFEIGPFLAWQGVKLADHHLKITLDFVGGTLNGITVTVLIPLLASLLLWPGHHLSRGIHDRLPADWRESAGHLAADINNVTAKFFRERFIVCLVAGLVTGIGWTWSGVPYGLLWGAGVGILSLVPFLSLLALPPTLLHVYYATSYAGDDWKYPAVFVLCVFLMAQALEAFVLLPNITVRNRGLNGATTLAALVLGVLWAGWFGMLLAIPIAGILKALIIQLILPDIRARLGPLPTERDMRRMGSPLVPANNEAEKPNETPTP